jgi:hypothetical protein
VVRDDAVVITWNCRSLITETSSRASSASKILMTSSMSRVIRPPNDDLKFVSRVRTVERLRKTHVYGLFFRTLLMLIAVCRILCPMRSRL